MRLSGFAWWLVVVNAAVPLGLLAWDALRGDLGANPVNFAIHTTGILALIFLMLSLLVTPLSRVLGWHFLTPLRRVMGLYAFGHTLLHFLIFFTWDREASLSSTVTEITSRNYLMVGMFALLGMVPLAITSTNSMIRKLGPKFWKRLHWLAYPIAIASVAHFGMQVKADLTRPIIFATILTVLLLYRLVSHYLQLRADSAQLRGAQTITPVVSTTRKHWKGQLCVARIFTETPGVKTFRLVNRDGGRLPFDFSPGQYLNLTFTIDGKTVKRSYTIASSPLRVGSCEITVMREENGLVSRYLHDTITEGAVIDVAAPAGKFTFTGKEAESIVFIAAGVGITPIMSKIRTLTDIGWPGKITLLYSVKTAADIIFRDELLALQQRFPNLHVSVHLTRDPNATGPWAHGRLSADHLRERVPEIANQRVHFCGPTEMTNTIRQMLTALQVPDAAFYFESFTSPARKTSDAPVTTESRDEAANPEATLTFQRSGKSVERTGTKTVLELAEEQGIPMNFDCRSGICGQCKTRLVEGRVTMETQDALTAADRANNVILSCQARCIDDVVVDA